MRHCANVIGWLIVASAAHAVDAPKPNVILIMADDLSYADLSCYGSKVLRTPHIDKMAAEGLRLTDYYAGCTVCTPSRMALLTGAYPLRVGWRGGVVGYGVRKENGLAAEATTMAEIFKAAGYRTYMSGKWHIGNADERSPMAQGFDGAFYIKMSNNQTKDLWKDDKLIQTPFNNRLLSQQFTQAAIDFIRASGDRPFFLYLPYTAPHFPAEAHPDWDGKSKMEAYGDVVEELDARVGQILQTLRELKIDEKTLVVFTSDNGTEKGQQKWGRATPYRGLKWTALEGGNRVPCVWRWPGKLPAGKMHHGITGAIDLLPTLARACGIRLDPASQPKVDGIDVWLSLTGQSDRHPREDLLIWHGRGVLHAVRVGDWKLYVDKAKDIRGADRGPVLVNLSEDPTEQTDLAAQHPDRVKAMRALAAQKLDDIRQNAMPLGGPPLKDQDKPKQPAWLN